MPVMVVGSVDLQGHRSDFSQGTEDQLTVSAPGRGLCTEDSGGGYAMKEGTSLCRFLQTLPILFSDPVYSITSKIAAAMVSGLAAYLLSADLYRQYLQVEGEVAQRVKQLIQELAYRRIPTGFLLLYNGMPYIPP
jgi:hypothetical protein